MTASFRYWSLALVLAAALGGPSAAQDKEAIRRFGDDLFVAGRDVQVTDPGLEDVYAAGRSVAVQANARESVHAAGRTVRLAGAVGRDAYAAGRDVEIRGPVTGDVTAFGARVEMNGSAGDDAILVGREVEVAGPIAGNATLVGREVEIAAPISGSVQVRADRIRFGPAARIDGTLAYWSPNRVDVPASVIAPNRVTGVRVTEPSKRAKPTPTARAVRFLAGVVLFVLLAALFAAVAPGPLERAHEQAVRRPWLNLLMGIIATSAIFGSILVLVLSIVGIPLAPVVVVLAPFALAMGYLTAAFTVGRLSLGLARVRRMEGRLGVFVAMATGVVLLAILRLVPIFGWLVLVAAVVVGLGAWFSLLVRPRAAATASGAVTP